MAPALKGPIALGQVGTALSIPQGSQLRVGLHLCLTTVTVWQLLECARHDLAIGQQHLSTADKAAQAVKLSRCPSKLTAISFCRTGRLGAHAVTQDSASTDSLCLQAQWQGKHLCQSSRCNNVYKRPGIAWLQLACAVCCQTTGHGSHSVKANDHSQNGTQRLQNSH